MPVAVWIAVISTPGRTAPVASFTEPLIWAVPCGYATAQLNTKTTAAVKRVLPLTFIFLHFKSNVMLPPLTGRATATPPPCIERRTRKKHTEPFRKRFSRAQRDYSENQKGFVGSKLLRQRGDVNVSRSSLLANE